MAKQKEKVTKAAEVQPSYLTKLDKIGQIVKESQEDSKNLSKVSRKRLRENLMSIRTLCAEIRKESLDFDKTNK